MVMQGHGQQQQEQEQREQEQGGAHAHPQGGAPGWALLLLGILIVAATVTIVSALAASTAATKEQTYRACVEAAGMTGAEDIDDMVTIAERCWAGVYGEEQP